MYNIRNILFPPARKTSLFAARCTGCGFETIPDIQASQAIKKRGLQCLGVGITLQDSKLKAFRSETLVSAS